jgi:hypothetical protein
LTLASNPRRHQVSLTQICRLTELAFKLKCLATGMPFGDEPRRQRKEDRPGYWTGPSAAEALEKIYGSKDFDSVPPDAGGVGRPASGSAAADDEPNPVNRSQTSSGPTQSASNSA